QPAPEEAEDRLDDVVERDADDREDDDSEHDHQDLRQIRRGDAGAAAAIERLAPRADPRAGSARLGDLARAPPRRRRTPDLADERPAPLPLAEIAHPVLLAAVARLLGAEDGAAIEADARSLHCSSVPNKLRRLIPRADRTRNVD